MTLVRRRLPAFVAAGLWLLVVRLGWALFTSDLTFEYVAGHSRRSADWWYRVAGLWGGSEGSLLLFAAIVTTVVAIAAWGGSIAGWWPGPTIAIALATIVGSVAWPFDRLAVPAVEGFGLTPILEHPAMAVHPPLLYLGIAATLPPLLGTGPSTRRWLLLALATLTAAMTLGAVWSYVEQGWGGYWAWDPIENASLAPWLATIAALHAGRSAGRVAAGTQVLPGVVALAGAASSRSGAVSSVHSFAEAGGVGWALAGLALLVAIVAVARVLRAEPAADVRLGAWPLTAVLLVGTGLLLVVLLTAVPLIGSIGGRDARLDGHWFALFLAPVAIVVGGSLTVLAVRDRALVPRAGWIAHAGILVLLGGIAGSTFDRSADGAVASGETAVFADVAVTNRGLDVVDGPSPGTTEIIARLVVDGRRVAPSLVAYPERGGILAETALIVRPMRDIQIVLNRADDDGTVLIEVRTKPLVPLIWIGATTVAIGALLSRRRAAASPACEPATR